MGSGGLGGSGGFGGSGGPDGFGGLGGSGGLGLGGLGGSGQPGGSGGVGGSGDLGGSGAGGSPEVEAFDFAGVQEFMLTWNCRGCHEGEDASEPHYPREADALYALLTSYVVEDCGGLTLVVPGQPDQSGIVSVLEGKCAPEIPAMPPMEFGPTPEEKARVRGWVANGALP